MIVTLCLSFLAFQTSPSFDARALELFRWFDGLGYAQAIAKPVVAVKQHGSDGTLDSLGFLTEDTPDRFKVLDLSLIERTYSTRDKGEEKGFGHEPYDLETLVQIFQKRDTSYVFMDYPKLGRVLSSGALNATIPWILHKRGLEDVAEKMITKRESSYDEAGPTNKAIFVQTEKDSVAWTKFDFLTQRYLDPKITRAEILPEFKQFLTEFPDCSKIKEYRANVDLLEKMVKEDQAHAAAPLPANASRSQKIADLIWQFRNDPGNGWWSNGDPTPAKRLEEFGVEAVPQLIEALHGTRFTHGAWYQDSGPRVALDFSRIRRVRDVAYDVIQEIAHRRFSDYGTPDYAVVERSIKSWFASVQTKGEESILLEGVRKADTSSPTQAKELARKYSEKAMPAIEGVYPKLKDAGLRAEMLDALEPLPGGAKLGFIRKVIHTDKDQRPRLAAINALASLAPDEAVQHMVDEWNRIDRSEQFPMVFDQVAGFLIGSKTAAGVDAVAKGLSTRCVDQRLRVVFCFAQGLNNIIPFSYPVGVKTHLTAQHLKGFERSSEDLLASALQDRGRGNGSMSVGEVSFTSPEVSQLACFALSQCFPTIYSYKKTDSPYEEDKSRLTLLNVYRARHGLVALPLSQRPKPVAFPNTLGAVSSDGSLTVEESALVKKLRRQQGQVLTAQKVLATIEEIAKAIADGRTRGANVIIDRGSDGSGISIRIQYHADRRQGSASITLGSEGIRGMGGGDARSFVGTQDDYLPSGIRRCMDAPSGTPFSFSYEIPKA